MLVQWVLQDLYSDTMLIFQQTMFNHEVHSILAFYLNHNQLCCNNQDHKKKHHAHEHKKYYGKPFSTREENPANPLLYSQEKDLQHHRPSTQKGALQNQEAQHPREVRTSALELVLAEISKITCVLCFLNGEITFIYTRLDTSKVVSIGTTGLTSITRNIINNYHINYLLH